MRAWDNHKEVGMSDTIVCPECKHYNPEHSQFCNNCGISLKEGVESREKFLETKIEAAAANAETETYERITKWAKLSTWVISIALTIIGATISVAAYLGLSSTWDYKESIRTYKEEVESSIATIKEAEERAKKELDKLKQEKGDLNRILAKQITIDKQLKKSKIIYEHALEFENKFFDLNIHIDANTLDRTKLIESISTNLINKGFIVDAEKILFDEAVNKTEVLFYSEEQKTMAESVAKDVAQVIGKVMKQKVGTRFVTSSDRNRYKILIKIANQSN